MSGDGLLAAGNDPGVCQSSGSSASGGGWEYGSQGGRELAPGSQRNSCGFTPSVVLSYQTLPLVRPTSLPPLFAAVLLAWIPPVAAQQPALQKSAAMELAAMHNAALAAFNAGKWAEAAAGLEKVISMIADPVERAKIGPLFFTLGAAYFNGKNYAKAIEIFKIYLTQYPQAERVGEARLASGRAMFLSKDYDGAAKAFAAMESVPALRDQALAAQAECFKQLNRPDDQIRIIEKLIQPEIKSGAQATSAVTLAELYLAKNETEKVLNLINTLHARVAVVDNVVALNVLTVKLGDELAEKKSYPQALAAYRVVRTREQVIAFQSARIAAMDKRMQANLEAARGNAQAYLAATGANREIELQQAQAKQLLEEFTKLPDYWPAILFRNARVWYEWDKKWEAIVAFDRLLTEHPEAKESEPALYSTLVCYADLNRTARTLKLCDEYLAKYPKGPNAATVGYLKGASALQNNDPKSAVTFFGTMLEKQPNSEFREQMRFLLGNAQFMQGEFEEARKQYTRYVKDFPKGSFFEEATYREALTLLFQGKYEETLGKLKAYLQQYPGGAFAADAGYRVLVCKYAASLFEEVIADAKAWETAHPNDLIAGEVFSLLGDALAAESKTAEAAEAYTQAYQRATSDEVLNYAIFEASKQLQKQGKWPEVARMFEEFVTAKPDHPTVVAAMFWISKAKAREGQTEEAKTFLVEQLKRYLNEPKREAVEQLLQQLAQLCSKRPRPPTPPPAPAPEPNPTASGAAPSAPPPTATPAPLPPYDAVAEMKKQLEPLAEIANETGKARLLYARAELLKLVKREPEAQALYQEMADRFPPENLSPVLLATVGDFALSKGDHDKATKMYADLREDYPKSDYLDYAYVGLGEIALAAGEAKKALELFTHAADEIAASKIKEATIGRARAQLELKQYAEAKKGFEQVAGIREWRGESTAQAIYYLGEIEAQQGRWAEAIAHFQRVFVAYQKFLPWAARAYVRSAECFDKLGKRTEAVGHLKEMLRNEKLRGFPETKRAAKMLVDWGAV